MTDLNKSKLLLLLALIFFCVSESYGQKTLSAEDKKEIANLIPRNSSQAVILQMSASERYLQLTQKMQEALADKKEWLMEYIKQTGEGKLKYHLNFGITESEYNEIIAGAEDFRLVESGKKKPFSHLIRAKTE